MQFEIYWLALRLQIEKCLVEGIHLRVSVWPRWLCTQLKAELQQMKSKI